MPRSKAAPKVAPVAEPDTEPDYTKLLDGTVGTVYGWCQPTSAKPEFARVFHANCAYSYTYFDSISVCGCGCHKSEEVTDVEAEVK